MSNSSRFEFGKVAKALTDVSLKAGFVALAAAAWVRGAQNLQKAEVPTLQLDGADESFDILGTNTLDLLAAQGGNIALMTTSFAVVAIAGFAEMARRSRRKENKRLAARRQERLEASAEARERIARIAPQLDKETVRVLALSRQMDEDPEAAGRELDKFLIDRQTIATGSPVKPWYLMSPQELIALPQNWQAIPLGGGQYRSILAYKEYGPDTLPPSPDTGHSSGPFSFQYSQT